MSVANRLKLTASGEREIVLARAFVAPRAQVFEALTTPDDLRQWLLGPPGWSMTTCEVDLRVGGAYRYVWRHENGTEMGMGGVYREIARPDRLLHTEHFDEPWYPGQALIHTELAEAAGKTTMIATCQYESQAARDAVLQSGMEQGVAISYDRLDASMARRQAK